MQPNFKVNDNIILAYKVPLSDYLKRSIVAITGTIVAIAETQYVVEWDAADGTKFEKNLQIDYIDNHYSLCKNASHT